MWERDLEKNPPSIFREIASIFSESVASFFSDFSFSSVFFPQRDFFYILMIFYDIDAFFHRSLVGQPKNSCQTPDRLDFLLFYPLGNF